MPPLPLVLLVVAWILGEWVIDRRHRSSGGGESRDAGTLRLLHLAIGLGFVIGMALGLAGIGRWPAAAATPLHWLGLALMASGLALRWWAVHTLQRWFTVDVAIRADHRLVQHGPYRWLRHPSYTGMLMVLTGLGLALGWAPMLALLLPALPALARRIRVEEAALATAFPDAWPGHAARTWRLLPGLW